MRIPSRLAHFALPHLGLDRLLFRLCAYGLPLVVTALSLWALAKWPPHLATTHEETLGFRVLAQEGADESQPQALQRLAQAPLLRAWNSQLSEQNFWLRVDLPAQVHGQALGWVEFPSRHAQALSCWDAQSGALLGRADRAQASGAVQAAMAGFALQVAGAPPQLLCRAQFAGPARVRVQAWGADELPLASQKYRHYAGLLDGGLILLSLFLFITALINRNPTYSLFSVWLLLNLRMAALSGGWDFQWLGQTLPLHWLLPSRSLTIGLYYLCTYALFRNFFRDELRQVGAPLLLRLAQWSCLPLLGAALALPYASFLPLVWWFSALNVGVLVFYLVRILWLTRSEVAMWYGASLCITLAASLAEVLSAAFGAPGLLDIGNSVTAALSSSLLASLSVAAQIKQEQGQRLEAQAKLEQTFEVLPIGLFTLNTRGEILAANPALHQMLGSALPGTVWQRHFEAGAWTALHQAVYAHAQAELEFSGSSHPPKRYLVRAALTHDRIEGSLQDVTARSLATENLHYLAHNDALTRVLNRRGIEERLAAELAGLGPEQTLALAYLDLDRFKLINDLYGHGAGDEVLQQVCARVQAVLVAPMQFGRVGGDEFLIVMGGVKIGLARLICQGIVASIGGSPYRIDERAFQVRGSMGLIEVGAGSSIKDAIATADRACREAKSRPQCEGLVVFERDSQALREHEAEMGLVAKLSSGDELHGLFLEMQPIMSLHQPRASLNFEVLLRMKDEQGRRIPTPRLIAAAENSGRMGLIDRWVLNQTLVWLNEQRAHLSRMQFVCLNLSGASLNDERFVEDVFEALESHPQAARHLCLEITESVALHDLENTRRFIAQVRQYGAKVALDDFGAGYTSFSYLKELPGDLLKIDGSFIVNMNEHPANIAIVEAIVSLARNLGMKTVAEWAEDAETVETLAEIGVDYVQGFVVARPQAAERLLKLRSSADLIEDDELQALVDRVERGGALTGMLVGEPSRPQSLLMGLASR